MARKLLPIVLAFSVALAGTGARAEGPSRDATAAAPPPAPLRASGPGGTAPAGKPPADGPRGKLHAAAFGAKCDGRSDDTGALVKWAAAIAAYTDAELPNGQCVFTQPLVLPNVDHVSLRGGGTRLVYAGASTTADLITLGTGGTNNCLADDWVIEDIVISSNTRMTAGDGLHVGDLCESELRNVTLDGDLRGNGNLWNGIHFAGGNSIHYRGYNNRAQNDGILINGDPSNAATDIFLSDGKITHSRIGLHIAGHVGGLEIDRSDILENATNVKIDQSQRKVANLQLFFGPMATIDVTSGPPGYGIWVTDPGGGTAASYLLFTGTWIASAGSTCFLLDRGTAWTVNMSGGTLYNCGGTGLSVNGPDIVNMSGGIAAYNKRYAYEVTDRSAQVRKCGVMTYGNKPDTMAGIVSQSC